MTAANHEVAQKFFDALSKGALTDDLLTPDMTAWTVSTGPAPREAYQAGVTMLGKIYAEPPVFAIKSLTAEDDRVAAEAHAKGTLVNGEVYENDYLFLLRVRDGRIASVVEFFNPGPIQEKIAPLFMAMRAQAGGR